MTQSTLHKPNEKALQRAPLTGFAANGHAFVRAGVSPQYVAEVAPVFRNYVTQLHAGLNLFEKSLGASATRATFELATAPQAVQDFVRAPALANIAAQALNVDRLRILHFNGFFKPGGGMPTPWHQDMGYIPLQCRDVVTLWVPLVDVNADMGALVFASGSHLQGPRDLGDLDRDFPLFQNPEMQLGDVSVHHGWCAHRSLPNKTAHSRAAVAISYFPDGALVKSDSNGPPMMASILNDCLPGLAHGDVAQGPHTPLVYDKFSE